MCGMNVCVCHFDHQNVWLGMGGRGECGGECENLNRAKMGGKI